VFSAVAGLCPPHGPRWPRIGVGVPDTIVVEDRGIFWGNAPPCTRTATIGSLETGLLVGFFLPGDSLLLTAGLLVSTGTIQVNILVLADAAFIGDQTGYLIGRKAGPAVFNKPDSRLMRREYVDDIDRRILVTDIGRRDKPGHSPPAGAARACKSAFSRHLLRRFP
jgi:hypothetical protein